MIQKLCNKENKFITENEIVELIKGSLVSFSILGYKNLKALDPDDCVYQLYYIDDCKYMWRTLLHSPHSYADESDVIPNIFKQMDEIYVTYNVDEYCEVVKMLHEKASKR